MLQGRKRFLGFTQDGDFALLAKEPESESTTSEQLVMLDIHGTGGRPEVRTYRFTHILNAIVAGSGIFALVSDVAGTLFSATGTKSRPSLFTIKGDHVTTITHSRAKDWDLNRVAKIGRQTPIVDVGASEDGRTIVTARKDGRISVWRPGSKPRFGTWGAMPMPELENIAHFDHGQELGETATWRGPPVLSVSPDGRYIASQSMGLDTNPVGGIKSLNPLLRIWDVRQRKEIARFYPIAGMAVKFAPRGDLLLSVSEPRPDSRRPNADPRSHGIDVWQLSPYPFEQDERIEERSRE